MALQGSFNTTAYGGRYLTLSWTATQSIANNTSTISWSLRGSGGGTTGYYEAGNFKVIIAGETVYSSSGRIKLYNGTLVASGTKTIAHNTDGSKSFSASAEAGIYYVAVNCSGSGSWALNSIPRAATITSAPDFNDEQNPTVYINNPAGSAVDKLEICITLTGTLDDIYYREISKTATSYTFNLTDADRRVLRAATTGSNSRSIGFYLATTIGGVIYYSKVWKTLTIINGTPTLAPTVKDVGGTSTALTGNNQKIIKGFNWIDAATGAAARKEAKIVSQSITCGSKVFNAATASFGNAESGTFIFSATDNRGNTTTQTINLALINYVKLTADLELPAPTTAGATTLTVKGNYFNGSFGAVNNTLTVSYRYKVNDGSFTGWNTITPTISNNTYTATKALTGLDYLNKYTFEISVVDKTGVYIYRSKTVKTTPIFDWSEDDMAINVPLSIEGQPLNDYVIEQGTKNGWIYRKWKSGLCECWYGVSHTTTLNKAWGALYIGDTVMSRVSYPFPYKSKPKELATLQTNSGTGWLFPESGGAGVNGTYQTAIYNICRPTSVGTEQIFYITIYAVGYIS